MFDPLWILADVALHLRRPSASPAATPARGCPGTSPIISAAVFVGGQLAAFLTFVASTAGYLLALGASRRPRRRPAGRRCAASR